MTMLRLRLRGLKNDRCDYLITQQPALGKSHLNYLALPTPIPCPSDYGTATVDTFWTQHIEAKHARVRGEQNRFDARRGWLLPMIKKTRPRAWRRTLSQDCDDEAEPAQQHAVMHTIRLPAATLHPFFSEFRKAYATYIEKETLPCALDRTNNLANAVPS